MNYSELTVEEAVKLMVDTFGGSISQMYERLVRKDYVLCKKIEPPPLTWPQSPYPIAFYGDEVQLCALCTGPLRRETK